MFTQIHQEPISSIQGDMQVYHHASGLRHVHFANDNPHAAFLIGFTTPCTNDGGLPHVLEHLVLCGSEKYPVRDPFMAMTSRSLASFMNARTYLDYTVYPFSSPSSVDYFNLMDVYLDAVFHPLLREADFLQEGWRFELNEDGTPKYTGVVFHEMQGALANKIIRAYHATVRAINPLSSSAWVSGGKPEAIVNINHDDLKQFHLQHYAPENALVVTYGAVDVNKIHAMVENHLQRYFEKHPGLASNRPRDALIDPAVEGGREITESLWSPPGNHENVMTVSWILGEGRIVAQDNHPGDAEFAIHLLTDGDHSPIRKALQQLGVGRLAFGALIDQPTRSVCLIIEDVPEDRKNDVLNAIESALKTVSNVGFEAFKVNRLLQKMEMDAMIEPMAETPSEYVIEAYPFLMRNDRRLPGVFPSEAYDEMRSRWADAFLPGAKWVQKNLIENPRRVVWLGIANPDMQSHEDDQIEKNLQDRWAAFSNEEKAELIGKSQHLAAHQTNKNTDLLPCMGEADLPTSVPANPDAEWVPGTINQLPIQWVKVPTAGKKSMGQLAIQFDLSVLNEEDWFWSTLLSSWWTKMGMKNRSWEEAMAWRQAHLPHLSHSLGGASHSNDHERLIARLSLGAVCVNPTVETLAAPLAEAVRDMDWGDKERLKTVAKESIARIRSDVNKAAMQLAKVTAQQSMLGANFEDAISGAGFLNRLKMVEGWLENNVGLLAQAMHRIHQVILSLPKVVTWVGDEADLPVALHFAREWKGSAMQSFDQGRGLDAEKGASRVAWTAKTAVNYCYRGLDISSASWEERAHLMLWADAMTTRNLHPCIREQGGAYGGYARVSGHVLLLMSYRDPRFEETFADFDLALNSATTTLLSHQELLEAKLSQLKRILISSSPFQRGVRYLDRLSSGRSAEMEVAFLNAMRSATPQSMQAVALKWLNQAGVASAFVAEALLDTETQHQWKVLPVLEFFEKEAKAA